MKDSSHPANGDAPCCIGDLLGKIRPAHATTRQCTTMLPSIDAKMMCPENEKFRKAVHLFFTNLLT